MNDKSYCRLQQTCRDLAEFIRNNRNISVKSHRTLFYGNREDELSDIDKEGMYAVRFDCLHLPGQLISFSIVLRYFLDEYSFETLCDFLREYRITSDTIAWGQSPKLDKEQLVTIFNILKPVTMLVRSFESNRFEALLQSKTIVSFTGFCSGRTAQNSQTRLYFLQYFRMMSKCRSIWII